MSNKCFLPERSGAGLVVLAAALGVFVTAIVPMAQAQTETVLYNFCSQPNCTDGLVPVGALAIDPQGNLYGAAWEGGAHKFGAIFTVTPNGAETVLYSFKSPFDASPTGSLIWDPKGNLYGTSDSSRIVVGGAVFELKKNNSLRPLHRFGLAKNQFDGSVPTDGLLRDAEGNLYGTTVYGGFYACVGGSYSCGTVFKISPNGAETILHAFAGGMDGEAPNGGLVMDKAGNLYGTTFFGGTGTNCWVTSGCGTLFEIAADGTETILNNFGIGVDGSIPSAGLAIDGGGNIYGTTSYGGDSTNCRGGCGTVFKLSSTGTESVFYNFTGGADGAFPSSTLIFDAQGNLYGTNFAGANGSVFKLTPDGVLSILYEFTGGTDGGSPNDGLVFDGAGNLYGTTVFGGNLSCTWNNNIPGCGVVFKVAP